MTTPSVPSVTPRHRNARRVLAFTFVCLLTGLFVLNDVELGIWQDEAYTLHAIGMTLPDAIRNGTEFQRQGPLYFIVAELWSHMAPGLLGARLLSTIFIVTLIGVLGPLIARELGLAHRSAVPLLLGTSPFIAWAASEARPYSLALALLGAHLAMGLSYLGGPVPRGWRRVGYIAICSCAVLTFYPAAFAVASLAVAAVLVRFGRGARALFLDSSVAGVLLIPFAGTVYRQISRNWMGNGVPHTVPPPPPDPDMGSAWWVMEGLLRTPMFARESVRLALAAAALGILVILLLRWRSPGAWRMKVLWGATLGSIGLLLAMIQLSPAFGAPRYLAIAVIPAAVAVIATIDEIRHDALRRFALAGAIIFNVAALASFQRNNRAPQDWRSLAAFVAERARPDELIIIHEPQAVLPLRFYYKGANEVHGLPAPLNLEHYNEDDWNVPDEALVRARVDELVCPHETYWIVQNLFHRAQAGDRHVTAFIRSQDTVLDSASFVNLAATRLRRTTGTVADAPPRCEQAGARQGSAPASR